MWNAVQAEIKHREKYCESHFTNAYSQRVEVNSFFAKIICGTCGYIYSRVKYTSRAGIPFIKWHCGSYNKTKGHKVCTNRYVKDEVFFQIFVQSWNAIAGNSDDYKEYWDKNLESEDNWLRFKTKQLMMLAARGPIEEFDVDIMFAVMDYLTVFEDGRFQIKFYDGTKFEFTIE